MIIIIGLIVLIAAVVAGVAGVLSNSGSGHALTHPFAVFGYHVTGSTGALFLYGIVVGAVAVAGLSLLLAGARRTARRGREARRGLKRSRHETAAVSQDRDNLINQRETARADTARADTASTPATATPRPTATAQPDGNGHRRGSGGRWHLSGRGYVSPRASAASQHAVGTPGRLSPDNTASPSDPAE
jgi:gas vesicle protein